MEKEAHWLSVDWGTSALRIRLVNGASLQVLAEHRHPQGIAATYALWRESGATERDRADYYRRFLLQRLRALESETGRTLEGLIVLLSGMAGSSIGMWPLDYRPLPFPVDGSGLLLLQQKPSVRFPFPLVLVSGVNGEKEVMRGEETKLIGAAALLSGRQVAVDDTWFVLPGTHAKHVLVRGDSAVRLETYMTGEMFSLLAEKSILAASVEKHPGPPDRDAFSEGVKEGARRPFLNVIFSVRVDQLFAKRSLAANYDYLSGLLIGQELRERRDDGPLVLVSESPFDALYGLALETLAMGQNLQIVGADEALVRGQWQIVEKISF